MLVVGETGLVRWTCGQGVITADDVELFVAHLRGTRSREGLVLIDIMHDITTPTASQRRQVAEAVQETVAAARGISCHVVASNSTVARGVLTAINWIVKTPFPEHVSASPEAGLAWAQRYSPKLDSSAVLAALAREVPWWSSMRWG